MSKWEKVLLGEIVNTNSNSYTTKEAWTFVNYLDTGNITNNVISEIQKIDLMSDKLPSRARRKVKYNSIIYSTVRPNQNHFGIIKSMPDNFLVSTGFAVLDVIEEKADADFIYYFLSQPSIVELLSAIAEQSVSTYPSIKASDIENLEVALPTLEEQKKISSILSLLSNKIELNRNINKNLEYQVQALYQQYFVNTENAERTQCQANDYFDISIGKTPPRKEQQWFSESPSNIKWISISDMGNCGTFISDSSEYLVKEAVKKFNIHVVPDNTVVLSFKLTVGRVAITDGEMTTNEAIAHFKTNKVEIIEYLYCYLKNFNYQTMGNTSSIAIAVNSKLIKAMPFIVPENRELTNFHELAYPLFQQIKANQCENKRLVALRDTLLPKLMSGEFDVSETEL